MILFSAPFVPLYDFHYLWAAGRIALDGGNVYDPQTLAAYLQQTGWPLTEGVQGFTHTPLALPLYMALAGLPYQVASWVWLVFSLALAGALIGDSVKSVLRGKKHSAVGFLFYSSVLFPPMFETIFIGQINLLMLAGISLFVKFWHKDIFYAGLCLTLTAIKAHLFFPLYLALFFANPEGSKRLQLVAGIGTGVSLLYVLSYYLYREGTGYYLNQLPTMVGAANNFHGATIGQIFGLIGFNSLQPWLLTAGTLLGGYIGSSRKISQQAIFEIVLPLSLLTSLYAWPHSFIVLLPAYLQFILRCEQQQSLLSHILVLAFAFLGILSIMRPGTFSVFLVVLPMAMLLDGIFSAKTESRPPVTA